MMMAMLSARALLLVLADGSVYPNFDNRVTGKMGLMHVEQAFLKQIAKYLAYAVDDFSKIHRAFGMLYF